MREGHKRTVKIRWWFRRLASLREEERRLPTSHKDSLVVLVAGVAEGRLPMSRKDLLAVLVTGVIEGGGEKATSES